ncbi:MAG: hypothetical protein IJE88_06885, partial [Akkermansia sp.]|nr:hypothetical protein [Akkermansia sp.]
RAHALPSPLKLRRDKTPWRAATHSATLRGSGHSLYHTQGSGLRVSLRSLATPSLAAAIAAAPWAKNMPP